MFLNRKIIRRGQLTIPLAILTVLSIISGLNSPDFIITFTGWAQITSVLALYFYFVNTLENDELNFICISKIFMYLSLLVTIEMLYFVYSSDVELIEIIRTRAIDLDWANLNVIIYPNIVAIPLMGYLVLKSKIKLPYMIISLFIILGILLALSRSSILTLGVYFIFLIPLIFSFEKQKMSLIIQGFIFLMFTFLGLYSSRYYLVGLDGLNYHNILAQASTLGILGIFGLIYLFYLKTKVILKSSFSFKWFVLILIYATAFVNGMLQPMYFNPAYMIYIFLIIACIEVCNKNENPSAEVVKKNNNSDTIITNSE